MNEHQVLMRILAVAAPDDRDALIQAYAAEEAARVDYEKAQQARWDLEERMSDTYLGKSFTVAQVEDEEMA